MAGLRLTRAARLDILKIGVFVADQSGSRGVGERFARRLRAKCEYLASLPGTMGCLRSELRKDIRSSAFGSYVILYRYVGNVLEVVTIMGHRDIDAYVEDESAGPSDAD